VTLESPYSHPQIVGALTRVERDVAVFFGSLSEDEFVFRIGAAWTPAEHLQHLNITVRAIARGLSVPPWLLQLRFRRSKSISRSYDEFRETYRAELARGAKAPTAYIPGAGVDSAAISEHRTEILARWARVNEAVRTRLKRWQERDLDQTLLPHPILKTITAREMLFFMLYHDQHHVTGAKSRLPRFSSPAGLAHE
jgi:hypothetical protein